MMIRTRLLATIGLLSLVLHISVCIAAPAPSAVAPVTCPPADSVAYTRAGCPCLILSRPADRPPLGYCPVGQRCSTSALDTMQKNHGLFADLPRAPKDYVHGMCLPCMLGEGPTHPEVQQRGRAAGSGGGQLAAGAPALSSSCSVCSHGQRSPHLYMQGSCFKGLLPALPVHWCMLPPLTLAPLLLLLLLLLYVPWTPPCCCCRRVLPQWKCGGDRSCTGPVPHGERTPTRGVGAPAGGVPGGVESEAKGRVWGECDSRQ
jgi:hypothetical protein